MSAESVSPSNTTTSAGLVVAILVAGATVTAALTLFGTLHAPNYSFGLLGSPADAFTTKSTIATGVFGLGLLQILLAVWMYGRLPGSKMAPTLVRPFHRVIGIVLFLATLPVAIHCMFAYGVQVTSARVTVHSLAGCFFYGAFVAKMIVVRSRRLPGWVLPTVGGVLVTLVAVIWYTGALWYLNGFQLPVG
jgi:hypothetical protein